MATPTCSCPPIAALFSTGNGGSLPPTRKGRGVLGVVTVNSMMRYSRGRGRASFVMSLPYSPLVYSSTRMDAYRQTDRRSYETLAKMSTSLHVVVPCRRHRAHTALVWILECSQVQEHPVLVPDSCLVPRPCTGWTPVCVCVCEL